MTSLRTLRSQLARRGIVALVIGIAALAGASKASAAAPPVAITNEPTEVKRATAILHGYLLPQEAEPTTYYFEYGPADCNESAETCGTMTPTRGPVTAEGSVEALKLTRLKPGSTYHYWLVANSAGGTAHGEEMTFTTVVTEPKEYIFDRNIEVPSPTGIGINQTTDDIYVSGFASRTVDQFSAGGELKSSVEIPEAGANNLAQLAVDNSGINGEQGDVYVADPPSKVVYKFAPNAEGALELDKVHPEIGQGHLSEPRGVAVDASGNIYVVNSDTGDVSKFSSTGTVLDENLITGLPSPRALVVDTEGNIYIAGASGTIEYTSLGACVNSCTPVDSSFDLGVTLDSANNLFIATLEPNTVKKYGPGAVRPTVLNPVLEREGTFANFPFAVAVDNTSHELYVTENEGSVKVFRFLEAKPVIVKTGPASQVSGPVESLNGTVNPGGQEPAEYYFEYGTFPCGVETCGTVATESSQVPIIGDEAIPVSVRLDDLPANTTFHYRIVGVNEESGVEYGEEQTFTTGPAASPPPAGDQSEHKTQLGQEPPESAAYPNLGALVPVPGPKGAALKPLTRTQKLQKALRSCRRDKRGRKRRACEGTAQKHFGTKHKPKKQKKH